MKLCDYDALPIDINDYIENANVFFSKEYGEYLQSKGEKLFYAYDEERIIPIRVRKKFIFSWTVFVSEPIIIVKNPRNSTESYLDNVIRLLEKQLKSMWTISTASCLFDDTPKNKCLRIPFGSHIIDLYLDEDILWEKVNSKHRNVIRKAIKEKVEIKTGGIELIKDYIVLDNETWKRSNTHSPGENYYIEQLNKMKDSIVVYIAYLNEVPQAGAIFYFNSAMCYYMYGCSADNSFTGSANLLLWTAIINMKKKGVKRFSFVGCRIDEDENSKYHGIQRFKERFGGNLEKGFLFRVVSNPFFYRLFCKVMQLRSREKKPYMDAIDEEIDKWKDIQK